MSHKIEHAGELPISHAEFTDDDGDVLRVGRSCFKGSVLVSATKKDCPTYCVRVEAEDAAEFRRVINAMLDQAGVA